MTSAFRTPPMIPAEPVRSERPPIGRGRRLPAGQAASSARGGPAAERPGDTARPYLTSVPDSAPEFDDERAPVRRLDALRPNGLQPTGTGEGGATGGRRTAALRAPAALLIPVPQIPGQPARPSVIPAPAPGGTATPTAGSVVAVRDAEVPSWSRESDIGVRRTASAQLPAAERVGAAMARALVEVLAARRPLGQLRVHCAPDVFAGLQTQRLTAVNAALSSVRVSQPADGVAEVTAVFRSAGRAHALAFRLQGLDGRWRVTELQRA